MYKRFENAAVDEPGDNDILWRFMRFPSFLSLLQTEKLFFIRLTQVRDPYECELPDWAMNHSFKGSQNKARRTKALQNMQETFRSIREISCVSCWHKSPVESAAMWNLYADDHGVAIRTSGARLRAAVRKSRLPVYIGIVRYIDFHDAGSKPPVETMEWVPFAKRQSFQHENEVRAMTFNSDKSPGTGIHVELTDLIEKVFLSPVSEPWLLDVVQRELQDHNLSEVKAVQSRLYQLE